MKSKSFFSRLSAISLLLFTFLIPTYGQELSEKSEISLLTCTPGEELYSLFGHSAIRVKDLENNIDLVFNYGTFDFNTPNFYVKFARGKLKYMLSIASFDRFKQEYIYEKRGITEQKLNLNAESKQRLFSALLTNYRPENRFYNYDFLFDNCSTRIRDIIQENGNVLFDSTTKSSYSFWNLLDRYMEKSKWIHLGIHLALGMPCDVEANPYQYMFLPENMMVAFENASIENNGNRIKLVHETNLILKEKTNFTTTIWYKRPLFIFSILTLAVLCLSILYLRKKKTFIIFDTILFSITGLLGWLIIFLWFFTDHQATGPNLNILWAIPLHFPIVFLLFIKEKTNFTYYYFLINSFVLLFILGCWPIIPQSLPNEILPFVVLLLIRSLFISNTLRHNLNK